MNRPLVAFIIAGVVTVMACQSPDSLPAPTLMQPPALRVRFPDIRAIAAQSHTPSGSLDQLVRKSAADYSGNGNLYQDSVRLQFLYNLAGQIIGYQQFAFGQVVTSASEVEQIARQAPYGVVYEYKRNRPYRLYLKGYEPTKDPEQQSWTMQEYSYTDSLTSRPTGRRSYRVAPDGIATMTEQVALVYDASGNLTEQRDVNGFFVHQRFTFLAGNLIRSEAVDPKTTTPSYSYMEYRYDEQPNPSHGLFWSGLSTYNDLGTSTNNVVESQFVDRGRATPPLVQHYLIDYDARGRIRRWATAPVATRPQEGTQWFYRYGP